MLWVLKIDTWLFFLIKFAHLLLLKFWMNFLSLMLPFFVFALGSLTSTFIIVVEVVVAVRKAHRHINLLFHHECLSRILRRINVHLYMLTSFNLLLDRIVELGRARPSNVGISLLLAISEAFVGNTISSLVYDLNGLVVICVIFGFTVILILHLVVLGLLIDIRIL